MQWIEYDNWDPQRAAADQGVDVDAPGLLREPGQHAAVPSVPRAARHGRRRSSTCPGTDSRQSVKIAADGRGLRDQHRAAQLLQPPGGPALGAALRGRCPNVRIMEIDIDDVPWKTELVTNPPRIENGYILVPTAPGWGADIVEDVLKEHPLKAESRYRVLTVTCSARRRSSPARRRW